MFPSEKQFKDEIIGGAPVYQRSSLQMIRLNIAASSVLKETTIRDTPEQASSSTQLFFAKHLDDIAINTLQLTLDNKLDFFPSKSLVMLRKPNAAEDVFHALHKLLNDVDEE